MCGRFALDRSSTELVELFDVDTVGAGLPGPSRDIAPTEHIAIVLDSLARPTDQEPYPEPVRRLEAARFGLVPGWAKSPTDGPPLINARSEDAFRTPSFANSVAHRRAVVPASGYFEWTVVDGVKAQRYVSLPGDELLVFAALYEWWRNPAASNDAADRWLLSASILTRASSGPLTSIHERMPVVLGADLVEVWLDPQEEGDQDLVDAVSDASAEVAVRLTFRQTDPLANSL